MREILFRGKRVDNGEWVYGDLDTMNYAPNPKSGAKLGISDGYETFDVLAKTVGQYTGLTDKNEKRIFEGDILKYVGHPISGEVEWCKDYACFICNTANCWEYFNNLNENEIEVIGNVHDTPELLEMAE